LRESRYCLFIHNTSRNQAIKQEMTKESISVGGKSNYKYYTKYDYFTHNL